MTKWDSRFNTEIGIPNVNIAKASGVSDQEVNANNIDTQSKVKLWLDTINKGLEETNKLFGLDLKCKLRFDYYEGGEADGLALNSRNV